MLFDNLFVPGKIGNTEIKNRLVVPPMVTQFASANGDLTERYIRYYEEKAKGGFGLIICENNPIERRGAGFTQLAGLWDGVNFDMHHELTERVHAHGAKIFVQIYHAGRETSERLTGHQPVAPSPIHDPAIFEMPHELTVDEIVELEDKFAYSIMQAKNCGYDGVELHGAHGYLINQFVSPFSNKRSDLYGGTLMNRLRFPLNIIRKAYEKTGTDFTLTYRISADEFVEGGLTIEDAKIISTILESAGIKAMHVSGAVYKTGHLPSAPYQANTALFSDLAKGIKEVVEIPVIAVNKINTPFVADSILKQGKADFVAIGRASIADPHFPNKTREGRIDDIVPCISCDQGCQGKVALQEPISCMVNPRTGREGVYNLELVDSPKRVMIVGGGIAGMQAAIVAATKGHDVHLFDRADRLGGQWLLAAIPPGKAVFTSLVVYQKTQLEKLGVKVHLNSEVTAETIAEFNPGHIVMATGASATRINLPGMDKHPSVVQATEILSGKVLPGRKVVVIGGGIVGVETAEHLAVHGSAATVVERNSSHLGEMAGIPKVFLMESIDHNKVDIRLGTGVEQITETGLIVEKDGVKEELSADQIVIAVGSKPNTELEQLIKGKYSYSMAGDVTGIADGIKSVKAGYEAALAI